MREWATKGSKGAEAVTSAAQPQAVGEAVGGPAMLLAPNASKPAAVVVANSLAVGPSDAGPPDASTSSAATVWLRGAAQVDRHYQSGQFEVIFGDEISTGTVLSGGVAYDYGHTSGTVISSGGYEVVERLAVASASVISSGGVERVRHRGVTTADVIESGGKEILSGGHASGALVQSGGALFIDSAGSATGAILSGGREYDDGHASGTVILSGGREIVSSGGVAAGSVVSGGVEEILSGGAISGGLSIQGGEAIVSGTVASGQTVSFTGASGVLELDNLAGFKASIAGLNLSGQQIDLGGFTYAAGETVNWTQSGTSGTLTVRDGAHSATLTLIGFDTSGSFQLANDGRGGTLVSDPPAGAASPPAFAPAAVRFAEVMAGVPSGRAAASYAVVHSGGSTLIDASPVATAATSGR